MAASSSWFPEESPATMAATRTPSGAMPRPAILPPKALVMPLRVKPLPVGMTSVMFWSSATQRKSLRSQPIAVTPDAGKEKDGLAAPDAHTSTTSPADETPATYLSSGDTATLDNRGMPCG